MVPFILHTVDFVEEAAECIHRQIVDGLQNQERFVLSLCGGNTPAPVYVRLSTYTDIDWMRVLITFGDERCTPPDHADSNYRMAKESLFDRISIPAGNILRIKGELSPAEAAQKYEEDMYQKIGNPPVHDLMLLGMGGDGHTASLFPGTEALAVTKVGVVANAVPSLKTTRLTCTLPLINSSRQVCFLVRDETKRPVVEDVLSGGDYPAGHVSGTVKTTWVLGW